MVETTWAAIAAALFVVAFVVVGAVKGFSRRWIDLLEVIGTSVTLIMVFVIQHTQARQQAAFHLKLDEVIRSMPKADNQFIGVETAPEAELEERGAQHEGLRQDAIEQAAAEET